MYSQISVRDKKPQLFPLFSKTVNQQAYKTALTYLNYDIDQLLLYFGTDEWKKAAHAQAIEKVYSLYECCDEYFSETTEK
ncbi:hypothetical protein QTN25_000776 [Entamoeba marina]